MTTVVTHLTPGEGAVLVGDGISLEGLTDAPGPRVGITIGGLDPNTTSIVNVWRIADGARVAVRGGRERSVLGAGYIVDYEVPLGRDVFYELEFIEGLMEPAVKRDGIRFESDQGYLSDPAVPASTVGVYSRGMPHGHPSLAEGALESITYESTVNQFRVMESNKPVVITSGRSAPSGVGIPIIVEDPTQAAMLRQLAQANVVLLVRPLPQWSLDLPGSFHMAVQSAVVQSLGAPAGSTFERWQLTGFICAPPSARIVIPEISYGDVELAWSTYQQFQDAYQGLTYLDAQKDPFGASSNVAAMSATVAGNA